jgi:endoglucanase
MRLKPPSLAIAVLSSVLTAAATSAQSPPAAAGFAHIAGRQILDPAGKPLHMRGTSLGNWLVTEGYMFGFENGPQSKTEIEALTAELLGPARSADFWEQYRQRWVTAADIHLLHQTGVNTIRIPLHYALFETDDAEGFRLVDQVVAWCRAQGIYVILDLHAAPGGQTGANIDDSSGYPWLYRSPQSQAHLVAIWQRLARHYKDNRTVIGYDLLNEPIPHFPKLRVYNPDLELIYRKLTAAIRPIDPNHILFLGGAQWDTNFTVFSPPFDPNTAYTFHTYWAAPEQPTIQKFVDFSQKYNVPLWLGESGENTDVWITKFRTLLETNDIGWTFWPYKKLAKNSAFVTVTPPENWDQIIAFAKLPRGTGAAEERLKARPDQPVIDKAFADLLTDIELNHATVNPGYLQALGLTAPAAH